MRKITRNPKLIKERDKMIRALDIRGFYLDEIGAMFRLLPSRIHAILNAENKQVDSAKK